jgi:cell division septation protein DedD
MTTRGELWALIRYMDYQLEAHALLMELSLPDGYSVREVEGRLFLFDPQGIPLHGPKDPSQIEAYAWRHAWRHIERELNEELADLHANVRPLQKLPRLRQYMRMLDAVAQRPRAVEQPPVRRGMVAWSALAASAATIAAIFLIAPLRTALVPERTAHPAASSQPATTIAARPSAPALPAQPRDSGNVQETPTTRALETSRETVSATRASSHQPTPAKYAVSFGEFVNRTAADTMMHLIRSKGYIVYVARIGEEFRVMTRPYHTRAQAERLVNALQEIGWPVQLATAREISSGHGIPSRE